MTARVARRAAVIAVALTALASATMAPVASAAGERVRIRTAEVDRALAKGAIKVRVRSSAPARVTLRAKGSGVRRLTRRDRIKVDGDGSRRVRLVVTGAGRSALESASRRCQELPIRVRARFTSRKRSKPHRDADRRELAPDAARCSRPAPGPAPGGDEPGPPPSPGGGSSPPPGSGSPPEGGGGSGSDPDPGEESDIRAGAATADITPPVGTPMFAYTARSRLASPPTSQDDARQIVADPAPDRNLYAKTFEPSEGIHTRLRASAIVVEGEEEKLALVQADLGGLPYGLVQRVLELVEGSGIEGENLALSATHTHSATGPIWPADSGGYGALGGDLFDPRIFEITAQGIAEAIIRADGRLEPARVGVGSSELRGASSNRALDPFRANPEAPADEAAARVASIDPTVTAIRVDGTDGDPIGVWSNFAIHQTSYGAGNLLLSGDNAATTERVVEREIAREAGLAEPAPAAPGKDGAPVLVWTNGAEGDISPNGAPVNPDGLEDPSLPESQRSETLEYAQSDAARADLAGIRVARGIVGAWRDAGGEMSAGVELGSRRTFLTFDGTPAKDEFEDSARPVGPETMLGASIEQDGACLPQDPGTGQGRKLPLLAGAGLAPQTASISIVRVGGLAVASFPFEITRQMGARITGAIDDRAGGRFDDTILAGLTNGYISYTSTPQEYDACQYEGGFTLFGRNQGPRLRDAALTLVEPLLDGEPAPAGLEPPPLGVGTPNSPPIGATPAAGDPVGPPPPATLNRYGRATFSWVGGDAAVDAPRGETFVELQRRQGGEWVTVETEEGPEDITVYDESTSTWTETWQFSECDRLGTYQFHVTGRAVRSAGTPSVRYEVTSPRFELLPTAPLEVIRSDVVGETARVWARYPDPGASLLTLPRRVRDGSATISLAGGDEVVARPDADRLAFEAQVPAGSSITGVEVTDACGNSTG